MMSRTIQACVDCVKVITNRDLTTLDLLDDDATSVSQTRVREGVRWWEANGWSLRLVTGTPSFVRTKCGICHSDESSATYEVEAVSTNRSRTDG
jgi:hypothetical protein